MTLYEKITSPGGKISYREYHPPTIEEMGDCEVDDAQVIGIHTALCLCMVTGIKDQLPEKKRMARELKEMEQACIRFARWSGDPVINDSGRACEASRSETAAYGGNAMSEILYDLHEKDYHALDRISKSYLWKLNTVPAAARLEVSDTPELVIGRAAHKYILEGHKPFLDAYAIAPKVDRRTKEGKALWESFQAAEAGKGIISSDDFAMIQGMSDAVHTHPLARDILEVNGWPEVSALWTDCESGIDCKARADLITPQEVIIDLKTCRDASPRGFLNSVTGYGYHVQAAWYLDAFRSLADAFLFIAVEKTPPYRTEVYQLDTAFLEKGRDKARKLVNLELFCRNEGYPHYQDSGVQTLCAPAYL